MPSWTCSGVALALGLGLAGCARPLVLRGMPATCDDGLPVRILVGVTCPRGVCGWTCAPDRWRLKLEAIKRPADR
jgi:hypothetical protein